jgi:hypothetical protein
LDGAFNLVMLIIIIILALMIMLLLVFYGPRFFTFHTSNPNQSLSLVTSFDAVPPTQLGTF